jgi:UPF0716 protein FxsA
VIALVLAFIVLPLAEIYVIVQVGHAIGVLNTIGVLFLLSIVGAWLTKHEGLFVITRIREQLDRGRMPTDELIDGALVLAGGLMLLTPGFITDAFGLLLLFPPTRLVGRSMLKRRFRVRTFGFRGPDDDVIDVDGL